MNRLSFSHSSKISRENEVRRSERQFEWRTGTPLSPVLSLSFLRGERDQSGWYSEATCGGRGLQTFGDRGANLRAGPPHYWNAPLSGSLPVRPSGARGIRAAGIRQPPPEVAVFRRLVFVAQICGLDHPITGTPLSPALSPSFLRGESDQSGWYSEATSGGRGLQTFGDCGAIIRV